MQTFLPYPEFDKCASCLDDLRLRNQRNECQVILSTIYKMSLPGKKAPTVSAGGMYWGNMELPNRLPWMHHPVVKMWREYRWALLCYTYTIIRECEERGFKDSVRNKLERFGYEQRQEELQKEEERQKERNEWMPDVYPLIYLLPHWLGNPLLHASHRAALLGKSYHHYSQYGWKEPLDMKYYWPV